MAASKSGSSMLSLANAKSLSMAVVTATKTTLTAKRIARISAKSQLWKAEKVNNLIRKKKFATCLPRLDPVEPPIHASISMAKLENAKCSYMEVAMAMPTISNQWKIAKQDANNRENSHSLSVE